MSYVESVVNVFSLGNFNQDISKFKEAYIKTVDTFNQVIIISNEDGNETMEIPMKNIKDIE